MTRFGRYLPISTIVKEPGIVGPRAGPRPAGGGGAPGAGVGGGPVSTDITYRCCVLLSNVIVRAPFIVSRFCSTTNVVGLVSLTMVIVPLPCALNASIVAGLNAAPSELPASGNVVRILPSFALR